MHSIEVYNPQAHNGILQAAILSGVDLTPTFEGQRYVGYGDTKYGFGPACVVDLGGTSYMAEPHVTWFPWTSAANRIVNFKWAMKYFGESKEVLLVVEKKQISFFEHFVKRGLLRKVGFLDNLPEVEEVHMYQYIRGAANE